MKDFYQNALHYVSGLNPQMPDYLEKLKTYGEKEKVPIIDDEMGEFLKLFCSLFRPKKILELGCGISYSTHWMLLGAPEAKITALDANHIRLDICKTFLEESGFLKNVNLIHSWIEDFFTQNTDNKNTFDLIFLDSTKKNYIDLLDNCYHSLNENGYLIADNIFYNGKVFGITEEQEKKYQKNVDKIKDFNMTIASHGGFESVFFPLSDGALVAQKIK